jgi:hypothetical protein
MKEKLLSDFLRHFKVVPNAWKTLEFSYSLPRKIVARPQAALFFRILSAQKKLSMTFVFRHSNLPFDWSALSQNASPGVITARPRAPWDFDVISRRVENYATIRRSVDFDFEFVRKNHTLDWNWYCTT